MNTKDLVAYSKVHDFLLGRYPNSRTYDERIIAQKMGYLVHDYGIYIGEVNFFWNKRGPYSRTLASALRYYEVNKDDFISQCSQVKIYENALPKLTKVKNIIDSRPKNISELYWLEIIASLKFLTKQLTTDNFYVLHQTLLKKKPFLNKFGQEIKFAWDVIKSH